MNFKNVFAFALVASLGACDGGTKDDDDDTDTDVADTDDTDVACQASINGEPFPAQNDQDVYYRATFTVTFTADESANTTLTLTKTSDMSDVALATPSWSEDGKTVFFKTAEPMEPSTDYEWTIAYGDCDPALSLAVPFKTSATGAAVAGADVSGKNFDIDITSAVIVEPAGVGGILQGLLEGQDIPPVLIVPTFNDGGTPDDASDDTMSFFGGIGEEAGGMIGQDLCTETLVFPEDADYSASPYFTVDADTLPINVEDISLVLKDVELSGSFAPDGGSIVGAELAGELDTRDILDLVADLGGSGSGDSAACELLSTFTGGVAQCVACNDGSGDFCMTLRATNITAPDVSADVTGGTIVERTAADIAADTVNCPT